MSTGSEQKGVKNSMRTLRMRHAFTFAFTAICTEPKKDVIQKYKRQIDRQKAVSSSQKQKKKDHFPDAVPKEEEKDTTKDEEPYNS